MINRTDELGADSETITGYIKRLDMLLGLGLSDREDISDELKSLIAARESVRQTQDWPKADELRRKLLDKGLEINDTAQGPVWKRD
jgi:cysteinyl-tRNA synthetase